MSAVRNYVLVTAAYWAFTLTDGALRMLVLLHFHELGYTPVELAFLFLFYEFFGVVTNLVGGWLASRAGPPGDAARRASRCRSSRSAMLALVAPGVVEGRLGRLRDGRAGALGHREGPHEDELEERHQGPRARRTQESSLFKWVAVLTGSKNALKGVGFFLGGLLLARPRLPRGRSSRWPAGARRSCSSARVVSLPRELGKAKAKAKFKGLLSKTRDGQRALGGAVLPLRRARHLVRRRRAGLPLGAASAGASRRSGAFLALWVDRLRRHPVGRARRSSAAWTGRPRAAGTGRPGARVPPRRA